MDKKNKARQSFILDYFFSRLLRSKWKYFNNVSEREQGGYIDVFMNGFCLARNLWALGQLVPNRLFSIVNEKSLSIQLKTERTHFGQGQEKWVVCIIQAQLQTNTYYVSFQSPHQKMIRMIMMKITKNFLDYDTDFGYQFYEDVELINDKTRKLKVTRFAK